MPRFSPWLSMQLPYLTFMWNSSLLCLIRCIAAGSTSGLDERFARIHLFTQLFNPGIL